MINIPIEKVKRIAKDNNLERLILIYTNDDEYGYTSYGSTKKKCKETMSIAENLINTFVKLLVKFL